MNDDPRFPISDGRNDRDKREEFDLDARMLSHRKPTTQDTQESSNKFNIWGLIVLFSALALAEWFGLALPGPIDDILYDAIIVLLYGGTLGLQDLLNRRKK